MKDSWVSTRGWLVSIWVMMVSSRCLTVPDLLVNRMDWLESMMG